MTTTTTTMLLLALLLLAAIHSCESIEYGVDCSFPQHSTQFKCDESLLGNRQEVYKTFMAGCREFYKDDPEKACDKADQGRIDENRQRVQYLNNFTDTGYKKTQVPKDVWEILYEYWLRHKNGPKVVEEFPAGGNVLNHWNVPTYMVNLFGQEESNFVVDVIYEMAKQQLEEWTGMKQRPVSLYGIRVYERGAILAPHLDRYPLVTSLIINVDQHVDEPWPLEVIGRDGKAVNITLEPGGMIFYESHSLVHGRPFALNGTYMANIFCHFEPTGRLIDDERKYYWKDGKAIAFPPYIVRGSPQEDVWREQFPDGYEYVDPRYRHQEEEWDDDEVDWDDDEEDWEDDEEDWEDDEDDWDDEEEL